MSVNYSIVDGSKLESVDFSKLLQKSEASLRYSVDGSKFIVKYEGEKPAFLNENETLNHEQVLSILNSPEWLSADPELS